MVQHSVQNEGSGKHTGFSGRRFQLTMHIAESAPRCDGQHGRTDDSAIAAGHSRIPGRTLNYSRPLLRAVFDVVVALGRYRWQALALGVLPFAAIITLMQRVPPSGPRFLAALALACTGLAVGWLLRHAKGATL